MHHQRPKLISGLGGTGLVLLTWLFRPEVLPPLGRGILYLLGFGLMALTAVDWFIQASRHTRERRTAMWPVIGMAVCAAGFVIFAICYYVANPVEHANAQSLPLSASNAPNSVTSKDQTAGVTGIQNAQNITNYNAPVTQAGASRSISPAPSSLEEAMTEALADPDLSPETKLVIERQRDLLPLKQEYRALKGNPRVPMKTPEAIAFFNKRLQDMGKTWQITPENVDSVFGSVMLHSTMGGAVSTGIKIKGGGGNTFDQTDIGAMQTGVDLEDTKNNSFSNTRISTPTVSSK